MAEPSSSNKSSNGAKEEIDSGVQEELKQLEAEIENVDKIIAREYTKLMRPVYERRREIFKKIPGFWPKTLKKHDIIAMYLQDEDGEVIQHLTDVFVEKDDDVVEKYKITFSFSENAYIKNHEVSKEFFLDDQDQISTKCANIEWHEGKDFSKKRKDSDENLSLFRWLLGDNVVEPDGWDLGKIIADDVYPNAQQYFQNDDEEEYNEIGEESEVDLGDEDDDDEEEDDEGAPPPNKRTRES